MGILISGFGAIGKTTLAKKYNNVIDLETSIYKYIINENIEKLSIEQRKGLKNRKLNPDFPNNYYEAIINNLNKFEIVCISKNREIINLLNKNKINYIVVWPKEEMLDEIIERCKKRGNNKEFISGVKDCYYNLYPRENEKVLWLNKGEFLEDILKREGYLKNI